MNAFTKQLLDRYAKGERCFHDFYMVEQELDCSDAVLVEIDFSESFILGTFKRANLRGAKFVNANVKTCDFSGANLTDTDFRGAVLDATTFIGAKMTGAHFAGARWGSPLAEGEVPAW